jgi:hypothetical protein
MVGFASALCCGCTIRAEAWRNVRDANGNKRKRTLEHRRFAGWWIDRERETQSRKERKVRYR